MVGTPEPAPPYETSPVFSGVVFETTVDIVTGPDGARLFVAERWGKIWSFDPREPQPRAELFADLAALHPASTKLEVYSLAFHPRFTETQEVFIRARMNDAADGARVLRFKVVPGNVPRIDPATAETVVTFSGAGHNGGNILFGPDKMLYVTAGDAGPATPPDPDETGQAIDDLEASILRIDIDGRDPGLAYRIPGDNPFVSTPGARGEIWAYGLRNPWKIAFRPRTADLWAGDVGWEMREMIHRIERGGNYGWAITEGPQPVKPHAVPGPSPIIPPIVAHPHTEAASITGGGFYIGTRLPELAGAYIYGDYLTGRIWALWHDGCKVTRRREIARTPHQIVTFGIGGDNELYLAAFGSDQPLRRLVPSPAASITAEAFPRRLSETGLFVDTARQIPHTGVTPYSVVAPLWQDGATTERWLAMTGSAPAGLPGDRRGRCGPRCEAGACLPARFHSNLKSANLTHVAGLKRNFCIFPVATGTPIRIAGTTRRPTPTWLVPREILRCSTSVIQVRPAANARSRGAFIARPNACVATMTRRDALSVLFPAISTFSGFTPPVWSPATI